MAGNLSSNALYRKYEVEQSILESINYWMSKCASLQQEVDVLNEKLANANFIKWQTVEPPTNGVFLVVYKGCVCAFERKRDFWMFHGKIISDKDTTAWCKLSDIKPYQNKEETK